MENIKLEKGIEIGIKRFYLDGLKIKSKCKKCNSVIEFDENDYLSHPVIGEPEELYMYCNKCDTNHVLDIVLNIEISFNKDDIKIAD